MKILQVVHDFLPKHHAGAEIYTFNLCRELARRHDVHLFFTECLPERSRYSVAKGRYANFECTRVTNNLSYEKYEQLYNNPRMDAAFSRLLDSFRPDIVHFQHLMNHSVNYSAIANKRGIPALKTLHDFWLVCGQFGKRIRGAFDSEKPSSDNERYDKLVLCENIIPAFCSECFNRKPITDSRLEHNLSKAGMLERTCELIKRCSKSIMGMNIDRMVEMGHNKINKGKRERNVAGPLEADDIRRRNQYIRDALSTIYKFITPSQFLVDEMVGLGYPADKFLLIDYGFDISAFEGFRREPADRLRFGFIGTIVQLKGVHVLIEAFRLLNDKRATLEIFGGMDSFPEYSGRLRQAAAGTNTTFHDRFAPQDVSKIFAQIDVLITPSVWYENSPLVIHEAFLSNTPVIASRIGGMVDLVKDGQSGLLFEPDSPDDLAKKMKLLLDDPKLTGELGANPPHVQSLAEHGARIESLYEEAIYTERSK